MIRFAYALQQSKGAFEIEQRGPEETMAICMSGPARTLVDSDVQEGFNTYIRSSKYARGLSGEVPDLFMYVRVGDSTQARNLGRAWLADTNVSAVQEAIDAMNPTASRIDESSGRFDNPNLRKLGVVPECFEADWWQDTTNVLRAMNFFEGWDTCHNMLEQQERKLGRQYDLVMFTRPDLLWKQGIPVQWFSPNSAYFGIDWWSIVPRNISRNLSNTLSDYFLNKDEACCGNKNPEWILFCRARSSCHVSDTRCYIVGRGEAVGERIKRPNGDEAWTHFWDATPTEMREIEKIGDSEIDRLGLPKELHRYQLTK